MAAITSAVVAIAAVILGWITIEIACKPCLDSGRAAIDHALDPNYDPDDARQPLVAEPPASAPPPPDGPSDAAPVKAA
ncbi:hypothetical protein Taro_021382 [Colocasia esculenta]|uniref:Outer envelope membrane protein 7 n=1 Tax=Colocasia esculenta TaxID=4460 RepID=A0A843V570_COLES|nr:hypothetical protein [Colocasia esculenta]